MSLKTPVSVLQEHMMRRGHTPQYELIADGTGTHDPIFKYKVAAAEITAIGVGRSKKQAKHEAARRALLRLDTPDPTVNVADIESPYKDKTQENSVGMLMDLCAIHNLPQPEFDLISDEGPAHAKLFTISCTVSKNQKIATGRTKKQAKQLAAQKLLMKLKESLGELPPDETYNSNPQIKEEELQKKLELLGKSPFASNYKGFGYKLSEVINLLKGMTCETLEKIRNNEVDLNINSLELIETLSKELNADLTVSAISSLNDQLAIIRIELAITVVQYGRGHTLKEAEQNAAAAAIRSLCLLSEGKSCT